MENTIIPSFLAFLLVSQLSPYLNSLLSVVMLFLLVACLAMAVITHLLMNVQMRKMPEPRSIRKWQRR